MQLAVTNVSIWLRAMVTEIVESGDLSLGDRQARTTENVTDLEMDVR